MMTLLFLCLAIPLATATVLMLFRGALPHQTARWIALSGSVASLLISLQMVNQYRAWETSAAESTATAEGDSAASPVQPRFEHRHPWLSLAAAGENESPILFELYFGLDGVSIVLIALTTVLTFSSVLISFESVQERTAEYYTSLLALEAGLIGVFCAFDLVLFYVFFELTLIPLFFLIAIWGGPQRRYAAFKFFLYTLAGSLITLLGLAALVLHVSAEGLATPSSIPALASWLQQHPLSPTQQALIFLAISAGFFVKVPLFPFHTWLPLAHVEAPTAGSVLLAGVLLKLGTYGFLRLCLPFFPVACLKVGLPLIGLLSVVGIIYGSFCALAQRDIKKLVAYSSVAHLGFCMLGLFALNVEGISGGVLQMINHGLSTGALFLLVGMVYDRYHSRQLDDLGGLANRLPLLACGMVFISMASIGLPGLNGFTGEVLSLAGMFRRHPLYGVLGLSGVVLGAWYLLTMVQYAFFGPLREPHTAHHHADQDSAHPAEPIRDMGLREGLALAPLALLCLWIGVFPNSVLDLIRRDVEPVAALYRAAEEPGAALEADVRDRSSQAGPRELIVARTSDWKDRVRDSHYSD